MRISIRRCLTMLRNTRNGNELALPATNAYQGCNMLVSCACFGVLRYHSTCRCAGGSARLDLPGKPSRCSPKIDIAYLDMLVVLYLVVMHTGNVTINQEVN